MAHTSMPMAFRTGSREPRHVHPERRPSLIQRIHSRLSQYRDTHLSRFSAPQPTVRRRSSVLSRVWTLRSRRRTSLPIQRSARKVPERSIKKYEKESRKGPTTSAGTATRTGRSVRSPPQISSLLDKPLPKRPLQGKLLRPRHRHPGIPVLEHHLIKTASKKMRLKVVDSCVATIRAQSDITGPPRPQRQSSSRGADVRRAQVPPPRPPRPAIFLKDVLTFHLPISSSFVPNAQTAPADALLTNHLISLYNTIHLHLWEYTGLLYHISVPSKPPFRGKILGDGGIQRLREKARRLGVQDRELVVWELRGVVRWMGACQERNIRYP